MKTFVLTSALSVGLIAAAPAGGLVWTRTEGPHPIAKVEHLYARTASPQQLFEFLRDDWPCRRSGPLDEFGAFSSGGVSAGNAVLGVLRYGPARE